MNSMNLAVECARFNSSERVRMTDKDREALQFLETGLQHMWKGEVDAALALYDRASAIAESDDTREVITIRKAEALIAADRDGAEISA
ncbi:MAG TPA: hypothetical protein VHK90_09035, partial [Thermoanaerobaculia bacterium]|nr:hypothetical protein [Thermoanaerobaculia bacterium]